MLLVLFIVLGTFPEGFAMLVLTLPIVFPVVTDFGFDAMWFGVVMVIVLEMGLISLPVGVNVFVVKGIAPNVPDGPGRVSRDRAFSAQFDDPMTRSPQR
jgi:TRAP-type C4-dicarboxylate transport system permease large subunit